MGIDSSSFALEVLKYYPYIAIFELFKILLICLSAIVFPVLVILLQRSLRRKLLLSLIYTVSYFLLLSSSVLRYPALYQDYFPSVLNKFIFKSSIHLNPYYLSVLAISFLLLSILFLNRKSILWIALSLFLLGFFNLSSEYFQNYSLYASYDKPPIILIGIDSLRSDHLRPDIVPNIIRLKDDPSTIYWKDHIIGIPRTFPSWMELLSGKHSAETGIRHMFPSLFQQRKHQDTLINLIQGIGYSATVISDFAGDIFPRFNAGANKINTPNFNLQTLTRMNIDQSFPLFLPLITLPVVQSLFPDLLENPCFSDPKNLIKKSISTLQQSSSPTFLTIFFSNAHFPYAAPWPWYSLRSSTNYNGPFFFKKDPDLSQNHLVSEEDIFQIRSLYSGSLSAIDSSIASLFQHLKENNIWEKSLIIITADHGEDLFEFDRVQGHGEHLRGENVLRVPLLIKVPNNIPLARNEISFTTRMIDLAPTLAGLLNLQMKNVSGLDLSSWFKEEKENLNLSAYSETEIWFSRTGNAFFQKERLDYPSIASLLSLDPGGTGSIVLNSDYEHIITTAKHRSLIQGAFKLIYAPTKTGAVFKLYDRNKDPENKKDISALEPLIHERMKRDLMKKIEKLEVHSQIVEDYVVPL